MGNLYREFFMAKGQWVCSDKQILGQGEPRPDVDAGKSKYNRGRI